MRLEDLGFQAMAGESHEALEPHDVDAVGMSLGVFATGVGVVMAAVILVPLGILGYMVYKANTGPKDDPSPEDLQRVIQAGAEGGEMGAVVETLAVAKNRKTLTTPMGIRVPNLARFMLPEADQMRAMSSMMGKGAVR